MGSESVSGSPPEGFTKLTERPHPLTPLIRGWVVLLALLIGFSREILSWFTEGTQPPPLPVIVGVVAGVTLLAGAAGFVSWLVTRFVIDGEELRVETGIVIHRSQRVAFDKVASIDVVQPLAARLFGLAELTIDIGSDERIKLRYLSRARAYNLRDYLLSRARGHQATIAAAPDPGLQLGDLNDDDRVILRIPPKQLLIAAVTSNEFIGLLLMIVITLTAVTLLSPYLHGIVVVVALAISAASAVGGFIIRRVTGQFNFTLSTRPAGLRISRGLTDLTSQSLPPRRIQFVRLSQSLLWRRLGWYRAEIDVIGLGMRNQESARSDVSSVLIPVADLAGIRSVLSLLWPEADFTRIPLESAPYRAHWRHPVSAPFLGFGYDDLLVVSRHGWLERRWDLVPHARVQSVAISQGPVSAWFGIADLSFHTAGSRFSANVRGLWVSQIQRHQDRLIALAQATRRDPTDPPPHTDEVPPTQ